MSLPATRCACAGYYSEVEDGHTALFSQDATQNNCIFDSGTLYAGGVRYFCRTLHLDAVTADPGIEFRAGNRAGTIDQFNLSARVEVDLTENLTLVSLTDYNDRDTLLRFDAGYSGSAFQTAVFTPGGFPARPASVRAVFRSCSDMSVRRLISPSKE